MGRARKRRMRSNDEASSISRETIEDEDPLTRAFARFDRSDDNKRAGLDSRPPFLSHSSSYSISSVPPYNFAVKAKLRFVLSWPG